MTRRRTAAELVGSARPPEPPPAAEVVKGPWAPERWYVARCHPHGERLARENLVAQDFEVYLPVQMVGRTARPLFPRYLFVRFDPSASRWRSIFSTRGVRELLMSSSDRPLAVPDRIVNEIRDAEERGLLNLVEEADIPCHFKKGDRVKLRDLPLEATFQERLDAKRVAVLLECLGRETRQVVHLARLR